MVCVSIACTWFCVHVALCTFGVFSVHEIMITALELWNVRNDTCVTAREGDTRRPHAPQCVSSEQDRVQVLSTACQWKAVRRHAGVYPWWVSN